MMSLRWALNWLQGNEKLLKQYQRETPFFFLRVHWFLFAEVQF